MKKLVIVFLTVLSLGVMSASASLNDHHHGDPSIGKPGDPAKVTRTIEIIAVENRFRPPEINVKQGETIKFIVKNEGKKRHEMVIDTMDNLKKHAKLKRADPDRKHEEANLVDVAPGEQKELVWHFTESGVIDFVCGYPGHFKKMRGKINVETK